MLGFVEVQLHQPLVPMIQVLGQAHAVEYEGLHKICFECEKYCHCIKNCSQILREGTLMLGSEHQHRGLPCAMENVEDHSLASLAQDIPKLCLMKTRAT